MMRRILAAMTFSLLFAVPARAEAPVVSPAPGVNGPSQAWTRRDGEVRVYYRDDARKTVFAATRDGISWSVRPAEPKLSAINLHGAVFHTDARGTDHVFYLAKRCEPECTSPAKDFFIDVLWMSRPAGGDWGEPRALFRGYVGALRQVAEGASGRLVLAFAEWIPGAEPKPPFGAHRIRFAVSDDGEEWRIPEAALQAPVPRAPNAPGFGAVEPSVAVLPDGRFWLLARTQTQYLWESHSRDGEHWEPLRRSRFASPSAPAYVVPLRRGGTVLLWNDDYQPARYAGRFVYGGRDTLHAALSRDSGATWRGFREIYVDPLVMTPAPVGDFGTGYPTGAELPDGRVVALAGQGDGRMAWIVFRPDWLEERSASAPGLAEGGRPGVVAFAQTGDVANRKRMRAAVATRGERPGEVRIDMVALASGGAALWNFPAAEAGSLVMRIDGSKATGSLRIHLLDRFVAPGDKDLQQVSLGWVDVALPGKAAQPVELRWDRGGMTLSAPGAPPQTMVRPIPVDPSYVYVEGAGTGAVSVGGIRMDALPR